MSKIKLKKESTSLSDIERKIDEAIHILTSDRSVWVSDDSEEFVYKTEVDDAISILNTAYEELGELRIRGNELTEGIVEEVTCPQCFYLLHINK